MNGANGVPQLLVISLASDEKLRETSNTDLSPLCRLVFSCRLEERLLLD